MRVVYFKIVFSINGGAADEFPTNHISLSTYKLFLNQLVQLERQVLVAHLHPASDRALYCYPHFYHRRTLI